MPLLFGSATQLCCLAILAQPSWPSQPGPANQAQPSRTAILAQPTRHSHPGPANQAQPSRHCHPGPAILAQLIHFKLSTSVTIFSFLKIYLVVHYFILFYFFLKKLKFLLDCLSLYLLESVDITTLG